MKRLIIALCILLCAGFTLSAAVNVDADDLALGAVAGDAELGGVSLTLGSGSAEVASSDDGQMLTLSGDARLSLQAVQGETISLVCAVPSDGSQLALSISSDAGASETIDDYAMDGATALIEYPIAADGTYSISSADGSAVSLYSISIE